MGGRVSMTAPLRMVRLETLEQIAQLARQVRAAQRTYYRTRDKDALIAAKTLERQLDTALAEWEHQRGMAP